MRICVLGAGATGGHFAVKLAACGHDVSVVARGAHLAAIQSDGLTLQEGEKTLNLPVRASADAAELGAQDFVIVGVKATGLAGIAAQLRPLVNQHTLVAFPQNGMAWWYPVALPAQFPTPPSLPIFAVGDSMMSFLSAGQIVGGSIYSANELSAPGIIQNNSPGSNRLTLGTIIPGADQARLQKIQAALTESGVASPPVEDIRAVIWSKLLVNMSGSTIALATENKSAICRTDPGLAEIYRRLVLEGLAIAAAHGYPLAEINPDAMLARLVDHKPSLLQDYEQHRPMEVAEIILAPAAFARAANVATPTLDALAAIVTRRARDRGLM